MAAGLLAGGLAVGLQFGDSALVCGAEKTAANTAASSEAGKLDTALTTAQLEKPIDKLPTMEAPTPIGVKPGDWSMWGGTTTRNNTPKGVDICTEWEVGSFDSKTGEWKRDKSENIKWVSRLGSQSYGNPVVANGQIYVGSNNGAGYLKRYPAAIDLGVLLAFNEADGKFLWQHSNEKLPTGRVHDWPLQGVCASAYSEGDRVWYVTNRGEVVCLDAKGFYDGVDNGPVTKQPAKLFELAKNEDPKKDKFAAAVATLKEGKLPPDVAALCETAGLAVPAGIALVAEKTAFKGSFKPKDATVEREVLFRIEGPRLVGYKILNVDDKDEADVIWQLNMMHDLGISQHNMCACSVTAVGDLLFVNTSNGVDEGHVN